VTSDSFDLAHIEPPGSRPVHKEEKHVDKDDRKVTRNYKRKHDDPHHGHGDHVNVTRRSALCSLRDPFSSSLTSLPLLRRRTLPRRSTSRSLR
jgi:hypothetical protein